MQDQSTHPILRTIRRIAAAGDTQGMTDAQLLQQFATHRDEPAFEVLVHRHAGMVWRVCRDLLRESHAAEDAFHATFLVLVRKAGSIARPELLGNWLYGVASRVALRARKTLTRRASHEQQGVAMSAATSFDNNAEHDLQALLQEELQRLPAKYRSPMVLCYLEGRTNEEAAEQLDWPVGTLKVRLMRGREMLRTRLARRGLAVGAGALTSALSADAASAVPAPLLDTTLKAALLFAVGRAAGTGALSGHAVALTEWVLKTMAWTRLKLVAALLMAVGLIGVGAGRLALRALTLDERAAKVPAGPAQPSAAAGAKKGTKVKSDVERLQGTWSVSSLEIEGAKMGENVFAGSKIVVDGNKFTTISMGATYKGIFKIDVASKPKTLDLMFDEGPEKGNTSLGIYELDGDSWKLCLCVGSKVRPKEFVTKAGSGHALETLKRDKQAKGSGAADAAGASEPTAEPEPASAPAKQAGLDKETARLEGEWTMLAGEINGQALPEEFLKNSKRIVKGNETTVIIGGQVFLKATFTVDTSKKPMTIDYTMTAGPTKGKKQLGIYEWDGDTVRYCFASPSKDRPTDFTAKPGSERTFSAWKKANK